MIINMILTQVFGTNMYIKCKYTRDNLDVDFYPHLLTPELAHGWYTYLESIIPHEKRRSTLLFGDPGLLYNITYRGIATTQPIIPWTDLPPIIQLKELVEKITGQKYTVCVVQRYSNGYVGINPHRDKEMVLGTRICGLSLGATRTISFTKTIYGNPIPLDQVNIPLISGSMYVMNPPTNQKWLHSIVKEPSIKESRISLTFRDYVG